MDSTDAPGITTIVASGILAQNERLSLIASNIANADSIATSSSNIYRAMEPVFEAVPSESGSPIDDVQVAGIVQSSAPPKTKYDPVRRSRPSNSERPR